MRAIVLAAGKSTRMGNNENKCIMPLDDEGHTILGRLLDQLKALSAWPVVVVGYQAERIMERYYTKASFVYNAEYENTGSLHSTWLASQVMGSGAGEMVMVVSGSNMVTDVALKKLFYTMTDPSGVAMVYPYPHHLKGVRNVYHHVQRQLVFGEDFIRIVDITPCDDGPPDCDYVGYATVSIVDSRQLMKIPDIPDWRTVNLGWAIKGCRAIEVGADATLDVNTPHDFELAKEMFGYG